MSVLQIIFGIVCLLASIVAYFRPDSELYLKLFFVYLVITNIVQGIGTFLGTHSENNALLYSLFSIAEFVFYFFVLREIIKNKKMKTVILYTLWIYLFTALFALYFSGKTQSFQSISYATGCLLIVVFCVFYFYELFQLPHSNSLLREPAFWICTAILFSYCCTFPLFAFANAIHNPTPIIIKNILIIHDIINLFSYLLFTIAFLCRIRIKKSMSSS